MLKIKRITKNHISDSIEVTLDDDTVLEFKAKYSGYEDCVNLVLLINGKVEAELEDVFIMIPND